MVKIFYSIKKGIEMIDFQQKLQELQNSLIENIGTGKDSTIEKDSIPIKENISEEKETPFILEILDTTEIPVKVPIEIPLTIPLEIKNQSIQNLEERVIQLENKFSAYQEAIERKEEKNKIENKQLIELEIKEKEESEKCFLEEKEFISMLNIYLYSVIINPKLDFTTELYQQYKENLTIISQNILANSFRFFEKDSILEETLKIGKQIQQEYNLESESLQKIQNTLNEMKQSLVKPSYQKNLYFAQFLNERGLILNAVAMINEILGEYIVASAQNLSPHAKDRVQFHVNRISISQTSRRAYYHFYKSANNFFYTQFNTQTTEMETTFFPYKDTGNEEIELQFRRLFQANRRNKATLFSLYSEMIYRIKVIRNDLVHGNNQRHYHNISYEIEDVLIDFEYLAIQKNFLGA